jgi:hypothetical protein
VEWSEAVDSLIEVMMAQRMRKDFLRRRKQREKQKKKTTQTNDTLLLLFSLPPKQ